jgi:hypothetical protein
MVKKPPWSKLAFNTPPRDVVVKQSLLPMTIVLAHQTDLALRTFAFNIPIPVVMVKTHPPLNLTKQIDGIPSRITLSQRMRTFNISTRLSDQVDAGRPKSLKTMGPEL